jgi:Domain of unknown function (DUF4190)
MKRCPNCNQTFEEDWLSFCTQDGTTLVDEPAAYEPPPTIISPPEVAQSHERANWNPPNYASPPQPQWQSPAVTPAWQPPPPLPLPFGPPPNKGLANTSMVIGIVSITVGWLFFGPIPAIIAIILGGVALSQIKKNPERVGGKPAAWVGIITGAATVVIFAIFLVFYVIIATA